MKAQTGKDWLYEKYWMDELTTGEMAELVGISPQTISNRMQKCGIPLRSKSDSHKLAYKKGRFDKWIAAGIEARRNREYEPLTDEHRAKLVAAHARGCYDDVWVDEERNRKISEAKLVNWSDPTSVYNSDAYRQSVSDGLKAAWVDPESTFNSEGYRQHRSEGTRGENNPNWRDGKSCERYPLEFNAIRKNIQKRDNSKCAICRLFGNHVHHIDYDKINNSQENLITLCVTCHGVTNGNREYWQSTLSDLLQKRLSYLEECYAGI